MKSLLLEVALALFLPGNVGDWTESPTDFMLETQSGRVARIKSDKEDDWILACQLVADLRREAVCVTQNGKLIVLLNPR